LELAISKLLARRLQGSLQAENRSEGGIEFVLELTVAPPATS
jgi:C4-dicarboxylate-specific signal transduction histidine kinase